MKPGHPSLSVSYNKDIRGIPRPDEVLPVFTVVETFSLTSSLMNLGIISMNSENIDSNLTLLKTVEQLLNDYITTNVQRIIDDEIDTAVIDNLDLIALTGVSGEEDPAVRLDIDTRHLLGANVAASNQKRDKDFKSAIDAAQSQKKAREKDHSMTSHEINDQQITLKSDYSAFKARTKDSASNFSEVAKNYIYSSTDYHYSIINEMFYTYATNNYIEPTFKIPKNSVWRYFAERGFNPYRKSDDTINPTSLTISTLTFSASMINPAPDTDNDFMTEVYKRIDAARRSNHGYRNHVY